MKLIERTDGAALRLLCFSLALCVPVVGCGRGAAPVGDANAVAGDANAVAGDANAVAGDPGEAGSPSDATAGPAAGPAVDLDLSEALFGAPSIDGESMAVSIKANQTADAAPAAKATADRLQLPADLPPPRLADFIKRVDIEMQNVASGRTGLVDQDEALDEMTRLAKLKLEASNQLFALSADNPTDQAFAIRGKLQALSHMAALGDLRSAEQLETLAWEQLESESPAVVLDSQLVLVGLAMERMERGKSKDSDEILGLIDRIATSTEKPDVSALMVMGQAHAVLQRYGDVTAAERVRQTIVDLFADHPNPDVAAMASRLAGSPHFARIDQFVRKFEKGEPVSVDDWRGLVSELLAQSPAPESIRHLAAAALQFEAFGNDPLAESTFEVIAQTESVVGDAASELAVAAGARKARKMVIGQVVEIDSPSVDGRPLAMTAYTGKVVLMPFWAVSIPESLTVMQTLDEIRARSDGKVEIIGMNLDTEDAPAAEFLAQSPVAFRSFQSASAAGGSNRVAKRFGVVSLPFVVVWGRSGEIVAINLTGSGLADQVRAALQD
jgi:hypothetical protein